MADNRQFILSTVIQVLDKATSPLQKIGKGFDRMSFGLSKTATKLYSVSDRMNRFGNAMSGHGRALTMGLTLPILGAGAAALKTFGDFEMLTANFTTMFGGSEKAAKSFLDEIEKFANVTPYTTKALAKNAQTMMQFGMSSKDTMKTLKQLGDIAGGNTERMGALSLAFAQVSSAGRLQGQDLLQMVNAGFNPLQIISQKTGKSIGELKDIMSKGGISAEAVAEAFRLATAEGGAFYKGAERGSKTLFGLFSTLRDEGEKSLRMLGESLKESLNLSEELPKLTQRIREITKTVGDWIKKNPELTKTIIKFLLISAALGPVLITFGKIAAILSILVRGFGFLTKGAAGFFKVMSYMGKIDFKGIGAIVSKAKPLLATLGSITAGFTAIVGIVYGLSRALDEVDKKFGKFGLNLRQAFYGMPVLGSLLQGMDIIRGKSGNASYNNIMEYRNRAKEVLKTSKNPEAIKAAKEILSQTEIYIKVEAEPGTSATIDKIKSKGNTKPKVSSHGYMGPTLQYAP